MKSKQIQAVPDGLLAELLPSVDLGAASFIVTIYGDIVVPRGGVLWTGTLIEICSHVGIGESPVRTAISRLVAANRLKGERAGRHSFYRLVASARKEFDQAAALLYAPDPAPQGWQIIHAPAMTEEQARALRLGHMGGNVFIRPDRGQEPPVDALVLHAADPEDAARLAGYWDLTALHLRYQRMLARFEKLLDAARQGGLPDQTALVARLLLVETYRKIVLRDPRLPSRVLPPDWSGGAARTMFRQLYAALTPGAERHIATRFRGVDGFLPARTAESDVRMAVMG